MQRLSLRLLGLCGALAFAALTACGKSSSTPPVPTPPPSAYKLYVAERGLNQVAVLDAQTGSVLRTISTGTAPSKFIPPNGYTPYLWVLNAGSNTMTAIDTSTDTVADTIAVAADPETAFSGISNAYIISGSSRTATDVDLKQKQVTATITLASTPIGIAGSSDMAIAQSNGSISFWSYWPTSKIAGTVQTAGGLVGVGYSDMIDDNKYLIVTQDGNASIYSANFGEPPIAFVKSLQLGAGSSKVMQAPSASSLSNTTAFVANFANNTIAAVNMHAEEVAWTATVGKNPQNLSYGDRFLYVANSGDDTITVLDNGTHTSVNTIKLASGAAPYDVAYVLPGTWTPAPASPSPSPSPTASSSPAPPSGAQLYVANSDGHNVLAYNSPFSASSSPAASVDYGAGIPFGIAAHGTTVAVEDGTGTLRFYNTPLSSTPYATASGPSEPGYMTFDVDGRLFVTTESNVVFKYDPPFTNSSAPSQVISGTAQSNGITLDASGNLYVGNIASAEIDVFALPYTDAPLKVTAPGAGAHIIGLAVSGGKLYASDATNNVIDVYALPLTASSTPAFAIPATSPRQLTFDAAGNLYAGDSNGSIDVYAAPLSASSTKAYSITGGIAHPLGIAIGP